MASHLRIRYFDRGCDHGHGHIFGVLSADLLCKQSNSCGDLQLPSTVSSILLYHPDHG